MSSVLVAGAASSVPVGTVIDYAGNAVPSGYLECDGRAVSRTAYAKLFAAIGTLWGAGDGSTTFNVPNLGWRSTVGAGQNAANTTDFWGAYPANSNGTQSIGQMGGQAMHTLTVGEMPSHSHSESVYGWSSSNPATTGSAVSWPRTLAHNPSDAGNRMNTGATGGGSAHSIMQPYAVVRKIIRAA